MVLKNIIVYYIKMIKGITRDRIIIIALIIIIITILIIEKIRKNKRENYYPDFNSDNYSTVDQYVEDKYVRGPYLVRIG